MTKSLRTKLILMFVAVITAVAAVMGLFSYQEVSKTIKEDTVRYSSQVLKQANMNLERYYREYEQGFLLLGSSDEFEKWIVKTPYESLTEMRLIRENYILPFQFRHPEILSITLKSDAGGEVHFTGSYGLLLGYSIEQEPWLSRLRFSDKVFMTVGMTEHYVDRSGRPVKLMVMTLAKSFGMPSAPGILKMDISLDPAQSILKEMELGDNAVGLISDIDGNIIVHPDLERIGKPLRSDLAERIRGFQAERGSFYADETDEIVVFDTIPFTGWKTIAIIHYPSIADSAERLKHATILIAFGGAAFGVLLIIPLTSSITRRISNLRRMMNRIKLGEFKYRVVIKGNDELADLGKSYNEMLDNLEQAVHTLAETKMRQQRAVLSALQSQIHSHFLYNTLESINSMAVLADHRDIEMTITSLSNMLRYISTYTDTVVTIGDELNHVRNYFQICNIRYGDDLSYEIAVEPQLEELPCLKAILQPIVENAIKHGLEASGERIHLRIAVARSDEMAVIVVEDNGCGFSPEALSRLERELAEAEHREEALESMTHVGIPNVLYRLKTYYKDKPAGIAVENIEPHGARVTIHFPVEAKEVRKHS